MSRRGRWFLAVGMALVGMASVPAPASAWRYRLWHGTLIENLDGSTARTSVSGDQLRSGSISVQPDAAPRLARDRSATLSNEVTYTRWANPAYLGPIFSQPSGSAKRIGRLHWWTEDGFPEVYLLLREYVNAGRHPWVQLRIPGRPNGRTGWVRRSALGSFNVSRWLLVVNRRRETITAYQDGRRVFQAPVGVGKPSTPTPPGHFWIRERFRVLDPSSPYFPYAMGTADYSTLSEWPGGGVVGIHGAWGQPWLIPGDPSHGCIRMHNNDDAWLVPRIPVGTPLHVI